MENCNSPKTNFCLLMFFGCIRQNTNRVYEFKHVVLSAAVLSVFIFSRCDLFYHCLFKKTG